MKNLERAYVHVVCFNEDCDDPGWQSAYDPLQQPPNAQTDWWTVGHPNDFPNSCPGCGGDDLEVFSQFPVNDVVGWLIGQPENVRSAYLGLRQDGMHDKTAREMAVAAHTPAPE